LQFFYQKKAISFAIFLSKKGYFICNFFIKKGYFILKLKLLLYDKTINKDLFLFLSLYNQQHDFDCNLGSVALSCLLN